MAHITSFSIESLAGRHDPVHMTLRRDVNIFYGVNGSGKSSLLKILHSALSGDASILSNVPFSKAEVRVFSVDHKTEFIRTFDKRVAAKATPRRQPPATFSLGRFYEEKAIWATSPAGVLASDGFTHSYLPTSRLLLGQVEQQQYYFTTAASVAAEPATLEDRIDRQFAEQMEKLWSQYFAEIAQKVQTAQGSGLADLLTDILSQHARASQMSDSDLDTAYGRVESFLQRQSGRPTLGPQDRFKERYHNDIQLQKIVNRLSVVEEQIENAVQPQTMLNRLLQRLFIAKRVVFRSNGVGVIGSDDSSIPLSSLSSGEKQMLRLLIECLTSHYNSTIIDEPELSLHVDWQHELVADLRQIKPESQLILATHSPEIMAPVPDENIFPL